MAKDSKVKVALGESTFVFGPLSLEFLKDNVDLCNDMVKGGRTFGEVVATLPVIHASALAGDSSVDLSALDTALTLVNFPDAVRGVLEASGFEIRIVEAPATDASKPAAPGAEAPGEGQPVSG